MENQSLQRNEDTRRQREQVQTVLDLPKIKVRQGEVYKKYCNTMNVNKFLWQGKDLMRTSEGESESYRVNLRPTISLKRGFLFAKSLNPGSSGLLKLQWYRRHVAITSITCTGDRSSRMQVGRTG